MKKYMIIPSLALLFFPAYSQQAPHAKKYRITVKTNVHANRGRIYMKVYPVKAEKGCKKQKYDLSKRDKKTVTIPVSCCWREIRFVEIGRIDKKKRVLGKLLPKEPLCERGKILITVNEGRLEKGMMQHRPIDIEVVIPPEKIKRGRGKEKG